MGDCLPLVLRSGTASFASVWTCRGVCRDWRDRVDEFLDEAQGLRVVGACFASEDALMTVLLRVLTKPARLAGPVQSLELEVRVRPPPPPLAANLNAPPATTTSSSGSGSGSGSGCSTFESEAADDLDEAGFYDKRARTAVLPLGLLSRLPSLTELAVRSYSTRPAPPHNSSATTSTATRHASAVSAAAPLSLPVQLGLANLHELADNCPWLTVLWAAHCEVDPSDKTMPTDVWGPDATPLVVRKLRTQCPRLATLGVLSSPGARVMAELRRSWPRSRPEPTVDELRATAEIQETYTFPLIRELGTTPWPCLRDAVMCVATKSAPLASGRACVLFYRSPDALAGGASDGELDDVVDYARDQVHPAGLKLNVVVRSLLARFHSSRGGHGGGGGGDNNNNDDDAIDAYAELVGVSRVAQRVEELTGGMLNVKTVPELSATTTSWAAPTTTTTTPSSTSSDQANHQHPMWLEFETHLSGGDADKRHRAWYDEHELAPRSPSPPDSQSSSLFPSSPDEPDEDFARAGVLGFIGSQSSQSSQEDDDAV